ncbi:AMIN-like domain-containing (lipo)protein [Klenkia soli]|nr:hypothetical protein [Klenkia soli]
MRRSALARGMTAVPLSALVLLAGCGGGDTDETSSTGTAASSTTSAPSTAPSTTAAPPSGAATGTDGPTGAATFPADTSPDSAPAVAGDGPTVVTAARVAEQDGFTRLVLDISGTATPGWDVAYTDTPTQEGSGTTLEVPGSAYLRITLTGVTNPYEAPGVAELASGNQAVQSGSVLGVYYDGVFEGQALAYVGLDAPHPFRVYALSNPTRVVVDVQD